MEEKKMKAAFEQLNPTREQQEQMRRRVLKAADAKKKPSNYGMFSRVVKVAVAVLALAVTINFVTDGLVVEAMDYIFHFNQGKQSVVGQAQELAKRELEVYAPDILYMDENRLVFGTLRGLVVYNHEKMCVEGTVDTQAIDCIYFNSDPKNTCVYVKNNFLYIFNTENEKPYGAYYQYDFGNFSGEELQLVETDTDRRKLNVCYKEWKKAKQQVIDTFDTFCEIGLGKGKINPNDAGMYSAKSYDWTDQNGEEYISYFLIEEEQYVLNTYQPKSKKVDAKVLDFESGLAEGTAVDETVLEAPQEDASEGEAELRLPAFVYTGDDLVEEAICRYMFENEAPMYAVSGGIWIPGFAIFDQEEAGDEILVFGNFWSYTYILDGNIFEEQSGGELPACIHLRKENGEYVVTEVDAAGDGAMYDEDIRRFTKDYPGVYEQYGAASENGATKLAKKKYLQMYIEENQLDVKYYKEYGWDPVAIFDD